MRALVLTPQMAGVDGISEMSRQVVGALEARVGDGLQSVEVWSLADDGPPAALDTRTLFRTARGSRLAFAAFSIRSRLSADVLVVVLHAHLLPVTWPLMRRGARIVPVLLGVEAWKPLRRFERWALRRAWRVAAISRHTMERFHAANPDLADVPVRICHLGLGAASIDHPYESLHDTSNGTEPGFALIVGRMAANERYKGHDGLLDVWPAVVERVPGARLVVAGGGDDRARLMAKAESLGLGAHVRFEGVVTAERLDRLYRDAAVFVMPSANEGFGLVFVEAMWAGTPCIAAAGAAEEIVEHESTGLIVAAGDRDALAAALIDLLGNRSRRAAMGRRAADVARARFSAGAFAQRLYHLLDVAGRASLATR